MSPDARREALVSAALPLVLEHGPAVTTRQIARAAEVAEGTIFRVFPHKDALVRAVAERALDQGVLLRELADIDRELPLRARLVAVVDALQRRLSSIFTLVDALGLHPSGHRHDDASWRLAADDFCRAVVDVVGEDADRLRVPPLELAATLRLLTFSATHPRISAGTHLDAGQVVAVLLDGLLHRPPGGPPPC
ncbi:MAG: regulatory protein TetR [Frankiales bacterium]|nr:regulatory protein TetR [Frankiales bacterium]